MAPAAAFEGWIVLELMGHRQVAGFAREVRIFGVDMVQVDIPEQPEIPERRDDWGVTPARPAIPAIRQRYGGSAVYCMTDVVESVARAAAARFRTMINVAVETAPSSRQLGASEDPPDAETVDDPADCLHGDECADPDCRLTHPPETT